MPDVRASVAYLPGRWAALVTAGVCLIADLDPAGPPFTACWDALESGAGVEAVLSVLGAAPVSFALAYRGASDGRLVVAGSASAGMRGSGAEQPVRVTSPDAAPWHEVPLDAGADVRLNAATEQLPEQSPALPLYNGIVLASCIVLGPLDWVSPEPESSPAFVVEPLNLLPEAGRSTQLSGAIPALPWRTPEAYGWEYSREQPSYADAPAPAAATPPPAPAPPQAPAPTPAPVPPPTLVRAVQCSNRHLNPPYPGTCRVCGVALTVQEPFTVERPSLGTLALSTGPMIELDRDVLLGRAPFAVNDVGTKLVPVPSPNNDISRNHVRIGLDGWSVQVTDLASTNGTTVTLPGQPPVRLRAHDPFTIVAGTSVVIADEIGVRYEVGPVTAP